MTNYEKEAKEQDGPETRVATSESLAQGRSYCYRLLMELCYFGGIDWLLASSERATSQIGPAMRKWIIRAKRRHGGGRWEENSTLGASGEVEIWKLLCCRRRGGRAIPPLVFRRRSASTWQTSGVSDRPGLLSVSVNTGHVWGLLSKDFQSLFIVPLNYFLLLKYINFMF